MKIDRRIGEIWRLARGSLIEKAMRLNKTRGPEGVKRCQLRRVFFVEEKFPHFWPKLGQRRQVCWGLFP
jgi:hypothetical protein